MRAAEVEQAPKIMRSLPMDAVTTTMGSCLGSSGTLRCYEVIGMPLPVL